MKQVGFTGSRHGMQGRQPQQVLDLLCLLFEPGAVFHVGCCLGADHEATHLAKKVGYVIHAHPGQLSEWSDPYWFEHADIREPRKNYMQRNAVIVHEAHAIIGTPREVKGGGTWATLELARRAGKLHAVLRS